MGGTPCFWFAIFLTVVWAKFMQWGGEIFLGWFSDGFAMPNPYWQDPIMPAGKNPLLSALVRETVGVMFVV
jgi:hypothetical protein